MILLIRVELLLLGPLLLCSSTKRRGNGSSGWRLSFQSEPETGNGDGPTLPIGREQLILTSPREQCRQDVDVHFNGILILDNFFLLFRYFDSFFLPLYLLFYLTRWIITLCDHNHLLVLTWNLASNLLSDHWLRLLAVFLLTNFDVPESREHCLILVLLVKIICSCHFCSQLVCLPPKEGKIL